VRHLERALAAKRVGPYQLQAAIAAIHVQARTPEDTDWNEITALYGQLVRLTPTPVVALNHAVAVAMSQGLEVGLERINRLGSLGPLEDYRLFHAARGDLLRRLGRDESALAAYERALELTTNRVERAYIRRRLDALVQNKPEGRTPDTLDNPERVR
jgi:RNA polymerase sigma-70 factor (ECF subfamily)